MGIMEKKMETTIMAYIRVYRGLEFRVTVYITLGARKCLGFRVGVHVPSN